MLPSIFTNNQETSFISAKEQQAAEYLLVRTKQEIIFGKQFMAIAKGLKDKFKDKLGLYEENGILKCAGRYKILPIKEDVKYPVLLGIMVS